jgi:pyruvate dehydrogenase E1 component alpha subunit
VSAGFFDDVEAEAQKLAEHIRSGCRALPNPTPQSPFDDLYVDMPEETRRQRDEFVDFVASLEEVSA